MTPQRHHIYSLSRYVTVLAERRKDLRLYTGSGAPYCLSEAYVLWLFFGFLGAHRYYCGQRDSTMLIYSCTLGLVKFLKSQLYSLFT